MARLLHRAIGAASMLAVVAASSACSADRDAAVAPLSTLDESGDNADSAPPAGSVPAITVESVAMVGDSITVESKEELEQGFATLGLDDVEIDAEGGRRMVLDGMMPSGLSAVSDIVEDDPPDLWVIALGTNDVANYGADEYGPAIAELLAAVPAEAPVVWVDTYLEAHQDESATFNLVLRGMLEDRGRATVVDWAAIAAEDGVLSDGIHPSGYGVDQFTLRVLGAVGDWMT